MTAPTDHWNNIYSTKSADELSWYQEVPAVSLDLMAAADLEVGHRVVDVGAGASTLADHLLGLGHTDVVLVDLAAAGLAATQQRLGDQAALQCVVGDLFDLEIEPVDMWHDRAVFHFLTDPQDQLRYKAVMANHVRPGGHSIVATFAPDGPPQCSGLPVTRYSAIEVADAFGPEFMLVDSRQSAHVTPWGGEQSFTFVLLRREASP